MVSVQTVDVKPWADGPGMGLFWDVYRTHYERISDQAFRELAHLPEFREVVDRTTEDARREQGRISFELLQDAMENDRWDAYRAHLIAQGQAYGQAGMTFSSWHRAVSVIRPLMHQPLVSAYHSDPERLTSALKAMAGYLDWALGVLGDQYEQAKQEDLRARAAELARANRRLSSLNDELEKFAWVAAHDLQEPLRKVRAFGDLLLDSAGEGLDDWGRTCVDRMQDGAARMQVLIDDLLSFSRVTTQARPFKKVDLHMVVSEVLSDLEVPVGETGARIEVGDLPIIEADPTQMRQLFQNLISNALKYREEGRGPEIRIASRTPPADEHDEWFCYLSVEDNGIGFGEEYSEKIFEVFQRLHGRSEYEGSGIGLAICRKIVERHGGNIRAEGRPGLGSTFTITLPLDQQEEGPE